MLTVSRGSLACGALAAHLSACSGASDGGLFEPGSTEPLVGESFSPFAPSAPVSPSALELSGRLEGQLNEVVVHGETIQNEGHVETWLEESEWREWISLRVVAEGEGGAAMMMLDLPQGSVSPLFEQGQLSSEGLRTASSGALPATTRGGPQEPWVGSCSGPAIGAFPDEQDATSWSMTAEEDEQAPGEWTVVVAGTFPSNVGGTTDLLGEFRFRLPE